ncbi:MAG: HEAT repeat domain-containing protein [Candidatus Riflebacteria bacterium]|nr:HEAT repeat domain-containing protein [Candidatus Riflebacteria bacterium]
MNYIQILINYKEVFIPVFLSLIGIIVYRAIKRRKAAAISAKICSETESENPSSEENPPVDGIVNPSDSQEEPSGSSLPLENIISGILNMTLPKDERLFSIKEAGKKKAEQATGKLIEALNDPDTDISMAASESLAGIGSEEAIEPLQKIISQTENDILSEISQLNKRQLLLLPSQQSETESESSKQIPESDFKYDNSVTFSFDQLPEEYFLPDGQPLPIHEIVLTGLKDERTEIRRLAAKAAIELSDINDPEILVETILNPEEDELVRFFLLEALGKISATEHLDCFQKCLTDSHPAIRYCCIQIIKNIPTNESFEGLFPALKDENAIVRAAAVSGLSRFKNPESLEKILEAVSDPEEPVNFSAGTALGEFSDDSSVEKIISEFREIDLSGKKVLLKYLPNIKNEKIFSLLSELTHSDDEDIGFEASMGLIKNERFEFLDDIIELSRIRDVKIKETLSSLQKSLKNNVSENIEDSSENMAFELLLKEDALLSEESEEVLSSALKHPNPQIRSAAMAELAHRDPTKYLDQILEGLEDDDPKVRSTAILATGKHLKSNMLKKIEKLSDDESEEVRYSLAKVLGDSDSDESRALLKKMANTDYSSDVRRAAKLSLKE